ncbi:MAG: hypothetical protein ACPLQO_04065 [Desulfotomaculales bacterium]
MKRKNLCHQVAGVFRFAGNLGMAGPGYQGEKMDVVKVLDGALYFSY